MSKTNNFTKHIAVLAFPFGTHAAPLFSLVHRLSTASPHAMFSFFSTAQSNMNIFQQHPCLDAIKPYDVDDGMRPDHVPSKNPLELLMNFLRATPGNFKSAMETAVKETGMAFSCIIADAFFWFVADMAEDLKVPWVAFWTAGPRSLLLHIKTDLIRENLGLGAEVIQLEKTVDFLPGFSGLPVSRIPSEVTAKDLNSAFPAMLYKMGLMLSRATSVVVNSYEELDSPAINSELKSKLQNLLNIVPPTLPDQKLQDPQGCLEWLDKQQQDSVVYVSFGRVTIPPPHELTALAEALEVGGFHFIWSFRGDPEEKLPKGFLERTKEKGIVVPWAPQLKILQHSSTRAFVTHGGWNSVLESIVGGVPLICRPFFGDQLLNSWIVEAVWGIGLEIEGRIITKDGALKALERILISDVGNHMKDKLENLKKLALDAASSHGSSTANFETLVAITQ